MPKSYHTNTSKELLTRYLRFIRKYVQFLVYYPFDHRGVVAKTQDGKIIRLYWDEKTKLLTRLTNAQ